MLLKIKPMPFDEAMSLHDPLLAGSECTPKLRIQLQRPLSAYRRYWTLFTCPSEGQPLANAGMSSLGTLTELSFTDG